MNELECNEYYHKHNKIPPITEQNWIYVYQIIFTDAMKKLKI